MRNWDCDLEAAFFSTLSSYLDLERDTSRSYSAGEYSLARMPQLAQLAGNPERHLRIVHVAGTKGKGSTCHFLASLLAACGIRVGVFASPHLSSVRERFQVAGRPIQYPVLLAAARDLVARLASEQVTPGFFEILTVLALRLFVRESCDLAILETGIGGRLDATNYISAPLCTAITPISYDHTQLLGSTIGEIAMEKAGILKQGVPLVLAHQPFPEAERAIRAQAAALAVPVKSPVALAEARPWLPETTPEFMIENFALALGICRTLGHAPKRCAFRPPALRGRFEIIRQQPLVVLDAAHNADSARRLAEALRTGFPDTAWTIVLGVVQGKDIPGIVRELSGLKARYVLTNPRPPKHSGLRELVEATQAAQLPHRVAPEIREASDLPGDQPLVFTGSFFTALIGDELFSRS
jgi:dihydrofolate synthase / folylpolyglutamate synthase